MISFSTGTFAGGADVDEAAEATRIARRLEPCLAVDGPLQYDAAASAAVGQAKRPGSPVAGKATMFVFPPRDTGNTTYKAVQRSAQVLSIGPVWQGLAKPVNDLSRGALVEEIIHGSDDRDPGPRCMTQGPDRASAFLATSRRGKAPTGCARRTAACCRNDVFFLTQTTSTLTTPAKGHHEPRADEEQRSGCDELERASMISASAMFAIIFGLCRSGTSLAEGPIGP
jgi:hypothetical protein